MPYYMVPDNRASQTNSNEEIQHTAFLWNCSPKKARMKNFRFPPPEWMVVFNQPRGYSQTLIPKQPRAAYEVYDSTLTNIWGEALY